MNEQEALLASIASNPKSPVPKRIYADWLDENGMPEQAAWWRGVQKVTGEEFQKSIIAQDDDNDYEESGWVACVFKRGEERFACLFSYSHCSCYDTWASLCGGGISDYFAADELLTPVWDWLGSVEDLIELAKNNLDPNVKGRKLDEKDWGVDHLREVYKQILKWNEGGQVCTAF